MPSISIIVPTFREAKNLPELIERIEKVRAQSLGDSTELIIVDDNSQDGTQELIASLGKPWVRLVVRTTERGLSSAVIRGLEQSSAEKLVVMDADLSHPPEAIPEMLARLDRGADFVIGSRYVAGGTTDAEWGVFRWLNSKIATVMARPFTKARDPMAGFFALHRQTLRNAATLNPIGYKIGLELIVKGRCRRVEEVPIHFADRTRGESKLNLKEQLRYLQHLGRLARFRYYRHLQIAAMLVVLAGFLAPTVSFLTKQTIYVDETTQLSGLTLPPIEAAKWLAGEEARRFGVPPDRSPPMSYWLGWAWSQVFGLSEGAMRWFGVLCAGLAVLAAFEITRRCWGLAAALVAGLLFALSPNVIVDAVEIRPYPVYLLFATLTLYCLCGFLSEPSRSEWKWLGAMALFSVLAMYTHFFGLLLAGAVFSAAFVISLFTRSRSMPIVIVGLAVLLASAGLWPFISASSAKSGDEIEAGSYGVALVRFVYRALFGHPAVSVGGMVSVAGMAAFLVLGLASLWPKKRAASASAGLVVALAAGMAVAALAYFVVRAFDSLNPSYNLWRVPALAMLFGSAMLVQKGVVRAVAWTSAGVLIIVSGYGAAQMMMHGTYFTHGPHRQVNAMISELGGPASVSIVHDADSGWGKMYFPIVYEFQGAVPQFIAEGEGYDLKKLPGREPAGLPQDLTSRYVIIIQAAEQGQGDLAEQILAGNRTFPPAPVLERLRAQADRWREVDHELFVSFVAADVRVFERIDARAP